MTSSLSAPAPSFTPSRFEVVPESKSSLGTEAVALCTEAGLHLDPWEAYVLERGLGITGHKWAAFEVGLCVPRQNGKGSVLEGRELAGLFLAGERLIIHSAHQFDTSLEAFRRLLHLIENNPDFDRRVKRVSRSHGEEGIELRNGQRIRFRTRTKGGGRGFTADCLILDEAMILPEAMVGALVPTLAARPNSQIWYTGSAVDQLVHDQGRAFAAVRRRAASGDPGKLAFFEWSLPFDDPSRVPADVLDDPEAWAAANPGLDIRITREHVANERRAMTTDRAFATERLNVGDWPELDEAADQIIDLQRWAELEQDGTVGRSPCLAFDIPPDRSFGSVVVAGHDDQRLFRAELVERRRGTGWIPGRILELKNELNAKGVVYAGGSPAAALERDIEAVGVEATPLTAGEQGQACGLFYDLVDQARLTHSGGPDLNEAIGGAVRKPLDDAWRLSRRNSLTDISPVVAVTLALWGASEIPDPAPPPVRAINLADL